jgi:hypothetical protein
MPQSVSQHKKEANSIKLEGAPEATDQAEEEAQKLN